ncbi:MAG: hypothetical protein ABIX01_06935 [Chitinophagaceae bacterium]
MKKHILFSLCSLAFGAAMAQSNVGVGTTAPKWALHVHNPTGVNSYINVTNNVTTDAANHGLVLGIQNNISYLWNFENVALSLATNNGVKMTISPSGNVGIGTGIADPGYKLDVANRMRLRAGTQNDLFTSPGIWLDDYRTSGNANAESVFFGMQDSIRLGFFGGGTGGVGWGMNFNAKSGKVNIGGYDGSYRLNISGSDLGVALYGASNNFYGSMINSDGNLDIEASYGSTLGGTPAKNILLNPPGAFFFYPGNVGINVAVPTARLQVNGNTLIGSGSPATGYQLSVRGKVICEEAKVQLNASWPDYVFASSYQRPTLYQVEDYILQHQHLPNIPSAAEVEKNGLLLGDMQKRMMEKVEELTLYLIDMKKENDDLKTRIIKLEQEKK